METGRGKPGHQYCKWPPFSQSFVYQMNSVLWRKVTPVPAFGSSLDVIPGITKSESHKFMLVSSHIQEKPSELADNSSLSCPVQKQPKILWSPELQLFHLFGPLLHTILFSFCLLQLFYLTMQEYLFPVSQNFPSSFTNWQLFRTAETTWALLDSLQPFRLPWM